MEENLCNETDKSGLLPLSAAARIIVSVCRAVVGAQNVGAGGATAGAPNSGSGCCALLDSIMAFFPLLRWVRNRTNRLG